MKNVAIITGVGGQQGSYIAELLLSKGYEVHGTLKPYKKPENNFIPAGVHLHYIEMTHKDWIECLLAEVQPTEIYNLAAINNLSYSLFDPIHTMDVNYGGLVRLIKGQEMIAGDCKIFQALSSEVFGYPTISPQNEVTPTSPRNPYGVSKLAAWEISKIYRAAGMKIYCGIMYNNDSPRRGEDFLSKKVCKYVAAVKNGFSETLKLGNINSERDFGYAKEYVEWIYAIMQYSDPDDFIMATGITHTIKEFIREAFAIIGIEDWEKYIEIDKSLYRPSEFLPLVGNATKSKLLLGFEPKTTFKELISIMMEHELKQYDK